MARFSGIPEVPTTEQAQWVGPLLDAIKQNVELLAGLRGEADRHSKAILHGNITMDPPKAMNFTRLDNLTVKGAGYNISDVEVPALEDYAKLITDLVNTQRRIMELAEDVLVLHSMMAELIQQLKG